MTGILIAVVAAVANSLGMVMQHRSISRASASGFDAKGIRSGALKPLWICGLVVMACGVGIQMVSLALTDLVIVQTIMVSLMFWVMIFAVALERAHIGRQEVIGSAILIVGVVIFTLAIQPGPQTTNSTSVAWALTTAVALVLVVILGLVARPLSAGPAAAVLGTAAGLVNVLGAGLASAALAVMSTSGWGAMFHVWLPYGAVAMIILSLVPISMAFAAGPASSAIAPMIAANPVIGLLLGVLLLGETLRASVIVYVLAAVALVMMIAGIVRLSQSRVIAEQFSHN